MSLPLRKYLRSFQGRRPKKKVVLLAECSSMARQNQLHVAGGRGRFCKFVNVLSLIHYLVAETTVVEILKYIFIIRRLKSTINIMWEIENNFCRTLCATKSCFYILVGAASQCYQDELLKLELILLKCQSSTNTNKMDF